MNLSARAGAAVFLSFWLSTCGSGSPPDLEAGQAGGRELPAMAEERVLWGAPRTPPEMAVSGNQLLLVGGIDEVPGEWDHVRIPRSAVLVDLETGQEREIAAPEADVTVYVKGVAADADGFVVVGERCAGGDRLPAENWACQPGTATAFRLNATDDTWEEIPFPDSVSPARGDTPWTFQPRVGTVPDGGVFVVGWSGPFSPGAIPTRLLVLEGTTWREVASLPDVDPVGACATSDALYVLTSVTSSVPEGTPPPAAMTLYEAPLEGGPATAVNLPDVDTSVGGVAVAAACDRSSVYLTSSTPDPTTPMQLYARTGTDWRLVESDWKAGIVRRMVSAPNGIAIVSREIDLPGPDSFVARTVGADETSAERVSSENVERAIVVDAATGDFLTIGPLPGLSPGEVESPTNRPSDPLTTDELTP